MQCYTELAPPTAVSHAIQLPFLSSKANNLIVAKNSLLQIFELKSTITEVSSNGAEDAENATANLDTEAADVPLQRTEHTSKLVLIGEFPLAGTVTSLARIKALNTKTRAECLLVAFRDAKLSLVEWDPETFNLHTISIHYYENPDLSGAPWSADLKDTYNFLTADPSSRCAAFKFGTHNLAILPFRQRDLVEDDYDSDVEGPRGDKAVDSNGQDTQKTPYSSSFVLPLTHLDPTLTHPVHLAFLYEYREPTFGIVASSRAAAPSLLAERKDILTYTVFTLDLEQKASTTLLSVQGLPYDINRVVPLPLPIGGALLVGVNEIVHVDQAGRTNGIAVNEFAKACTSFALKDQSSLALRLEGCAIERLSEDNGDVLVVLDDGSIWILTFTLDGRTVSGLTLQPVSTEQGGQILNTRPSCVSNIGRGRIFIGSEDGDSALLGWSSKLGQTTRKRSQADLIAEDAGSSQEDEDESMDDLDDDLYNDNTVAVKKVTAVAADPTLPGTYSFRIHDSLPSIAPIRDAVIHSPGTLGDIPSTKLPSTACDMLLSTGRGKAGGLTALNRELIPANLAQTNLGPSKGLWAVHAKTRSAIGLVTEDGQDTEANMSADVDYHQYLVVCNADANDVEATVVYEVNGNDISPTDKGDVERDGATMAVGTLAGGTKVVQIMRSEVRTYDSELNMDQMIPMEDETSGDELQVIGASFADPYLLVLREDSSAKIFKASSSDEVEDVECSGLSSSQWLSASLFKSSKIPEIYTLLLSPEGGLYMFAMSDLETPCYVAEGLSFLPPFLTPEYAARRGNAKAAITELLIADIGDATSKTPHLIIRTSTDDLVIYKAFHHPSRSGSDAWTKNLRWVKVSQQHLPRYTDEPGIESASIERENTLIALDNICGYSTVFQRGASPAFILKEASSMPRVIGLSGRAVKGLTSFHTSACQRGFAYIDTEDTLRISQFPAKTHYGHLGWAARRYPMGSEIHALSYHPKDLYILGMGQTEEYMLPDDTYHYDWVKEDIAFKPHVEQGIIKVVDAKTWTVIDTHVLDPQEVVICIKTLNMEYSETTHERRALVAVGTAMVRGEDLATKGNIRIFEVITVVPDPERPETNRRLRLIVKDEVKGAVSAISDIGNQGFMIMAQGQKCMVRGLKEDGTLLPVAFMDMQCYVTVLKTLPTTGMLLMGDAFKGLWFTGYTEEPYKMMLFGRSKSPMEVLAAEFLPFEQQLHIIVADADMNLQVLQFDPENPKSVGGLRLLQKSTFHTGHFPVSMHLLKSSLKMPSASEFPGAISPSPDDMDIEMDIDSEDSGPLHQILHTSQSGTLALLTPLSESTYRRLSGLATYLANTLDSPCGLNPRAYRAVENETGGGGGTRGILDGNLLMRWGELGEQRRREGLGKVGAEDWAFRGEREVLAGWGLFGSRA
ncbi:protein CFT1 [Aaosphaeria arxii CBS 175.79]|uniref:Protein CFT1 n=1 Tax=Aaosphaeria arxii CBS 175.79 TaxID=1450172 RepID=A0A6A5XK50_9PLEO|nr:protein CFT1 [Aaosphaeria arxii CBS 175.79]KAF2013333.1 protein CFT1 [Aaosphaeria arxii CBS 175.79]